ncbi:MAG: FHA domain-containing protein [Ruminiclostridium sp.]
MNVVKCRNGHFFDGDTYNMCPHCGEGVALPTMNNMPVQKPEKKGFFGKKSKAPQFTPAQQYEKTEALFDNRSNISTETLPHQNQGNPYAAQRPFSAAQPFTPAQPFACEQPASSAQQKAPAQAEHTLDFWSANKRNDAPAGTPEKTPANAAVNTVEQAKAPVNAAADKAAQANANPDAQAAKSAQYNSVLPSQNNSESAADKQSSPAAQQTNEQTSLRDAINKASASSEGKTMSYFSVATATEDESAATPKASVDPVVGWLVCIAGSHFGESFSIKAGKNTIGRNAENHIVLAQDNSVSRTAHASVVYEPKKHDFYLKPGDSSGLTYLNNEYIDETKKLTEHDIIELGGTKLMFVPLCNEKFSWEEYLKKE